MSSDPDRTARYERGAVVTLLALVVWAFRVSLSGQPAFSASLLDE